MGEERHFQNPMIEYTSAFFFFYFFLSTKSLACIFLVIAGSRTTNPSKSLVIFTWHPSREVSVKPKARSSMSFSSSSGSGIRS